MDNLLFLENYQQIMLEISNNKDINLFGTNIDLWSVLAAVIMAAFATVAIMGIGYVAYYIIIVLSTGVTVTSISTECIKWLKENKETAIKQFESLLTIHFISDLHEVKVSIKETHEKIKNKLIALFVSDPITLEKFIKKEIDINEL